MGSKSAVLPSLHTITVARQTSKSRLLAAGSPQLTPHTPSEVEDRQHLFEYILSGPLLASCGIAADDVQASFGSWVHLAERVIQNLGFPPLESLSETQRLRIFHYYLPIYFWASSQLEAHRAKFNAQGPPLVLGISAPQGCGKTTICEQLQDLFTYVGEIAASVSVDDFYLTYEGQNAVAQAHPNNRLLQYRGNAGTHDMELGTQILQQLLAATSPESSVPLPRYDKSKYGGRGDRAGASTWPVVKGPVSIILFEGWMSGFAPLPQQDAAAVDADLVAVNNFLLSYKAAWDRFVDSWLVVRVGSPQYVYDWRLQAELQMRASGKSGLTDQQVADFVDRFMPAYKAYLPGLYSRGPTTAQPGKLLVVEVDQGRAPLAVQPEPIM